MTISFSLIFCDQLFHLSWLVSPLKSSRIKSIATLLDTPKSNPFCSSRIHFVLIFRERTVCGLLISNHHTDPSLFVSPFGSLNNANYSRGRGQSSSRRKNLRLKKPLSIIDMCPPFWLAHVQRPKGFLQQRRSQNEQPRLVTPCIGVLNQVLCLLSQRISRPDIKFRRNVTDLRAPIAKLPILNHTLLNSWDSWPLTSRVVHTTHFSSKTLFLPRGKTANWHALAERVISYSNFSTLSFPR